MGFFDRFKTPPPPERDPLHDFTLDQLRRGDLVDYDLKTWTVEAVTFIDYGEGDRENEWTYVHGREQLFLSHDREDDSWCVSKKIPVGKLPQGVRKQIIDDGDPPERLDVDGVTYYLDETGAGHAFEDVSSVEGAPFVYWDYLDEDEERSLTIEQWGETEIEAYEGQWVERYHFTNMLPGGAS